MILQNFYCLNYHFVFNFLSVFLFRHLFQTEINIPFLLKSWFCKKKSCHAQIFTAQHSGVHEVNCGVLLISKKFALSFVTAKFPGKRLCSSRDGVHCGSKKECFPFSLDRTFKGSACSFKKNVLQVIQKIVQSASLLFQFSFSYWSIFSSIHYMSNSALVAYFGTIFRALFL